MVPKTLKYKNMSVAYLTGNCNDHVKAPAKDDEELLLVDTIAHDNEMVGIIVYQYVAVPCSAPRVCVARYLLFKPHGRW